MQETITNINQLQPGKKYSYADYLQWKFDEFVELLKGKVFIMHPAPLSWHQNIASNIHFLLRLYLDNKDCKVYPAPFDVRLMATKNIDDEKVETVVQPDICVICDKSKIDRRGCVGAPDLIVEITSPGTEKKDLNDKFDLYEQAGVKEYWVVFAEGKYMNQYFLSGDGVYVLAGSYFPNDTFRAHIFPDYEVNVTEVFKF